MIRILPFLTAIVLIFYLTENLGLSLGVGIALYVLAEILLSRYQKSRSIERDANRRDCMFFIQSWPDANGNFELTEEGEMYDRWGDLYRVVENPAEIEELRQEYFDYLKAQGNRWCADGLKKELILPVESIYAQDGENHRERREQYIQRCRQRIDEVSNQFHASIKRHDPKDYHGDVLVFNHLVR